jgi:hypothetical protein
LIGERQIPFGPGTLVGRVALEAPGDVARHRPRSRVRHR